MRLGFAGTPQFAVTILRALIGSDHEIVRAFTQPSRQAGRGGKLKHSPVYDICVQHDIDVLTLTKLKTEVSRFRDLDALVVAAYGKILPQSVLDAPKYSCINVHASLLPRWRGAAPIEYAILAGDQQTGVSIMHMTRGLDSGPVYSQASVALGTKSTLDSLTNDLADLGGAEVVRFLDKLANGHAPAPVAQDESMVTLAPKLSNEAERVNWRKTATEIERQVRAFLGRGAAFTQMSCLDPSLRFAIHEAEVTAGKEEPGRLIRLNKKQLAVGCGADLLLLKQIRVNRGKGKVLMIQDAMNGYPDLFRTGRHFDA